MTMKNATQAEYNIAVARYANQPPRRMSGHRDHTVEHCDTYGVVAKKTIIYTRKGSNKVESESYMVRSGLCLSDL